MAVALEEVETPWSASSLPEALKGLGVNGDGTLEGGGVVLLLIA